MSTDVTPSAGPSVAVTALVGEELDQAPVLSTSAMPSGEPF